MNADLRSLSRRDRRESWEGGAERLLLHGYPQPLFAAMVVVPRPSRPQGGRPPARSHRARHSRRPIRQRAFQPIYGGLFSKVKKRLGNPRPGIIRPLPRSSPCLAQLPGRNKKEEAHMAHDHDNHGDGVSRRHALECMLWAGTGVLWTVAGGIPKSNLMGSPQAALGGFTFLQISDSHVAFNTPANPPAPRHLHPAIPN